MAKLKPTSLGFIFLDIGPKSNMLYFFYSLECPEDIAWPAPKIASSDQCHVVPQDQSTSPTAVRDQRIAKSEKRELAK
jgi:hypothetical protein